MIVKASASLNDEDALEAVELYPVWATGTAYTVGRRISYNGILYRCVQAHTSQSDRRPSATPALWVRVSIEEWPEWIQPAGAHDAYDLDAKVSHNGKHWISKIPANVFEPGVAGWEEA